MHCKPGCSDGWQLHTQRLNKHFTAKAFPGKQSARRLQLADAAGITVPLVNAPTATSAASLSSKTDNL